MGAIGEVVKEFGDWKAFTDGLRERNRNVPGDSGYFQNLIQGCLQRRTTLPAGGRLFRSRIMPVEREFDRRPLSPTEMGAPPARLATAGRLNPDGIPCLYVAFEEDTAVAEVRPWTGAKVTVAQFTTQRDLEVLDLTPQVGRAEVHMRHIALLSVLIARPVHREDRWGYLGTQYLAETLKAQNVSGLMYQSALRESGRNLALFSNDDELRLDTVSLFDISAVAYEYRRVQNPLPDGL